MTPAPPDPLPRPFPGGRLRRLRVGDLLAFQAYRALPDLGRFQGWSTLSDVQALAFLDEMHAMPAFPPGQWMQIGIASEGADQLVGDIGIFVADDAAAAQVGYTLAPAAQGRGVATRAVASALALLFTATPVRQVSGITDTRNLASMRLLERLGFRLTDTRRTVFRGEPCDEAVYTLPRGASR